MKEVPFDILLNPEVLLKAFYQCRKNVGWKFSTQNYESRLMHNIYKTIEKLKAGENVSRGFVNFRINERGKVRDIRSVHISERVVQRALCDEILVPLLSKSLIYDNGANIKGKGISFARKRLYKHLRKFALKHGNNGYILLIDYKKFFDNINHERLYEKLERYVKDERTMKLIHQFIDCFGEKSLGLGSQISQICAIFYVNEIDHFVKESLKVKYYGRYMDDSYIICESKEKLKEYLEAIKPLLKKDFIILSEHKTRIYKLKNYFTYLKGCYKITESGKIVKKISHNKIVRERLKIRKLIRLIKIDKYSLKELCYQVKSWCNGLKDFDRFRTVRSMWKYFSDSSSNLIIKK